jgi:hypothetical protein
MEIELEKIKESTKQLELQIELQKLQKDSPESSVNVINNPVVVETSQNWCISDLLEKSKNSKVLLFNILKRYPDSNRYIDNGYGHYNGYSKEFKTRVESEIKSKFGLSPIKNNGKIYYLGLKFTGCTSFYNIDVYKDFVSKTINIPEENARFEKIPPGLFKYKIEYEKLLELFCKYTENYEILFENKCASGLTVLFKREFIEMICNLCSVKPPSYSNKTVKYFNGIELLNHI